MQNKTKISLAAIIAIVGISTSLIAFDNSENAELQEVQVIELRGSLPDFTVDELAEGTNYAIIGKVKEITPVKVERENRDTIFSDVTLSVKEVLYGDYTEKEIIVRIQGGQVDNLLVDAPSEASFKKNEKVLVFVAGPEPESIWGDSYYVAGLQHGKYKLEDGNAKQSHKDLSIDESDLKSKIKSIKGDK